MEDVNNTFLHILTQYQEPADKYGLRFIVLFGSYALGEAEEDNDVDVAVALTDNRPLMKDYQLYCTLLTELGRLLAVDPARIDLADLNQADILFRYEITAQGRLLAGDADDYAQYQAFAFRDYLDAASLFELEDFIINKRQQLLAVLLT